MNPFMYYAAIHKSTYSYVMSYLIRIVIHISLVFHGSMYHDWPGLFLLSHRLGDQKHSWQPGYRYMVAMLLAALHV